jgi:hypothetical protein
MRHRLDKEELARLLKESTASSTTAAEMKEEAKEDPSR